MVGSAASARAISQRRRSPPDSAIAAEFAQCGEAELAEQLLEPFAAKLPVRLRDLEHRHDIFLDAHSAEDRGFLRQVTEPQDRAAVHWQAGDVLPIEEDAAAVGLHQSHDGIEAGGLARAVGAEEADHLAAMDVERDVVKHRAAVVRLGDRAHPEAAALLLPLRGGPREGDGFVHCSATSSAAAVFAGP